MARDQKASDSKDTKDVSHTTNAADEGGTWQFKFVLAVIFLGVLMLILKSVGLF